MIKNSYIFVLILVLYSSSTFAQLENTTFNDTTEIKVDELKEEADINEILKTKAEPSKDKVQYFSQVTKYGFKDLFKKYSYNTQISYNTQVHPSAFNYIQTYMKNRSKYLNNMKGWGKPYFNLIDGIFLRYGLPRELKYIAVIESNLSIGATSIKGAGGPWQFMPGTARDYGLVVSSHYDERRDYTKSTHAAARYLFSLYRQFHDWLLVMAAYNGGPGRVYNAIKKSGSRNFWVLEKYLPEESRTYVKRFIATHYVMEGSGGVTTGTNVNTTIANNTKQPKKQIEETYTNDPLAVKPQLSQRELETTATHTITGKFNSVIIAKNLAVDILQFNRLNPEFDKFIGQNGNYDLRLPFDKMELFVGNKYTILNECVQVLLADNSISNAPTTYPPTNKLKTKRKT
jgi:membrane-bound lytic murein transglycosylase D